MDLIEFAKLVFAGLIGGLIGPLVNWGIEKRRETRLYKRDTIKRWREHIDNISGWDFNADFQDTSLYSEIKPYLNREIRSKIEIPRNTLTAQLKKGVAIKGMSAKQLLLDEIRRIEKDVWRLL